MESLPLPLRVVRVGHPLHPLVTSSKDIQWMFNERWRLSINGWREMLRQEPCGYCGGIGRDRGTVDHIIPRSRKPPSYHWDNLAAACFGCNTRRGDIPSLRFLLKRGRLAVKLRTEKAA